MKWYVAAIFGIGGLLYICSESKKMFLLKENAEVPMTKEKLNKWNRLNQILNGCLGLAYLAVPVCWTLEQRNLISNLDMYLKVSYTSIVIFYFLKRIENKRVFGRFFTGDILEEAKKDKDG